MSRQQRRYTRDEVAEALAVLAANGGNLSQTSRDIGIPRKTLQSWATSDGPTMPDGETRHEKKTDLSDLFRRELEAVFEAMKVKRGDASYADLSRGAGIYADKLMALTDSLPTQRVESKDTTESEKRAARILTMMDPTDDGKAKRKSA